MNKKILLCLLVGTMVLLLVGATVLYNHLREGAAPEQLVTLSQNDSETTLPKETEPVAAEPTQQTTKPLNLAPDFTVYDPEGREVHLSDYIGKPVVLNFWASWCGPCKSEMPAFQAQYEALGGQIHFLMVNMTTDRETLESASQFIAQAGYTFPVFYDTQANAAITYGVYSLPTTYFIDAQGQAVAYATGALDASNLQKGIDMILAA